MNETSVQPRTGLARYLSGLDGWAMAFGCIIGWGAFVMPATDLLPAAGAAGSIIGLVIGALIMLVIGANFAYLMVRRPGIGGVYSYTKEAFGQEHAFLCSWFMSLSYISIVFLNATALLVISRMLLGTTLQIDPHYNVNGNTIYLLEAALSVVTLVLIAELFIRFRPLLQWIQTALALLLAGGTLLVTVVCVSKIGLPELASRLGATPVTFSGVMTIVLLSPWAFVGFDIVSLETAHFLFSVKHSWHIVALSILAGAVIYIATTLLSITAVPDGFASWVEYIASLEALSGVASVPTFFAAQTYMGTAGLVILGLTALTAILTGIIAAYRAAMRMLATMADDHILSEHFSNTRFSILFVMGISSVMSLLGRNALVWFVELVIFGAIVGFAYASASAYKLARKEGSRLMTVTGAAGTVISLLFFFMQLVPYLAPFSTMGPTSYLALALWCLLGFIFYWRTMRQSSLRNYRVTSVSSTFLFSLLMYSALMWFVLPLIEQVPVLHRSLMAKGLVLLLVVSSGFAVMLYVQNMLYKRHETLEREIIHSEESSRAKSQFLFSMSHDIRTPMNAVMGFAHLAQNKELSASEKDAYLRKIETSGDQLLSILNDVLDMSRIESGKMELQPEPANLCELFETVCDMFGGQFANKHQTFLVDDKEVTDKGVVVDRGAFNRVLLNLVSNAYKYTPDGGTVSATLRQTGRSGEMAFYELIVKDSGIGMDEEFLKKLFVPFEREKSSTVSKIQGTGLGMSITKSLIELMQGEIDVQSKPGEGSTFVVRLSFPLTEVADDSTAAPETASGNTATDFTGIHVLLAEDNEINREIAGMLLGQAGFILDTAEDGQQAVDKVMAAQPGDYDLILMDIQMPVMDGYTAARAIRSLSDPALANIPIIAMTANAFSEDERRAREAGMQGHVAKPLDPMRMFHTIASVLKSYGNAD